MSLEQVKEFLSKRDLEFIVDDSTYDPRAKPLTVHSQDPAPNAKVKQGRKIFLTVNAMMPPMVKMPKLINRSFTNAQSELESYGLILGKPEYVPDLQVNMVLKQKINGVEIAEGTPLPKGSVITLTIGDGLGNLESPAPDLKGKPFEEIQTILGAAGLQLGIIMYQDQPDSSQNIVLKQRPAPGSMVRVGDAIDVWIRGKDPSQSATSAD
jgi:beta-lactam-binding protein with PASTA domain